MEKERSLTHLIWCTPKVAPFNDLDIVPVNYSTAMQQSIYREEYLNERLQLWVDNLNLLYVAFTRAKKNLIIWGKDGLKGTVSELLQQAMGQISIPQHEHGSSHLEKSEAGRELCKWQKESKVKSRRTRSWMRFTVATPWRGSIMAAMIYFLFILQCF